MAQIKNYCKGNEWDTKCETRRAPTFNVLEEFLPPVRPSGLSAIRDAQEKEGVLVSLKRFLRHSDTETFEVGDTGLIPVSKIIEEKELIFVKEHAWVLGGPSLGHALLGRGSKSVGIAFFPSAGYCVWILNGKTTSPRPNKQIQMLQVQIKLPSEVQKINRERKEKCKDSNI